MRRRTWVRIVHNAVVLDGHRVPPAGRARRSRPDHPRREPRAAPVSTDTG